MAKFQIKAFILLASLVVSGQSFAADELNRLGKGLRELDREVKTRVIRPLSSIVVQDQKILGIDIEKTSKGLVDSAGSLVNGLATGNLNAVTETIGIKIVGDVVDVIDGIKGTAEGIVGTSLTSVKDSRLIPKELVSALTRPACYVKSASTNVLEFDDVKEGAQKRVAFDIDVYIPEGTPFRIYGKSRDGAVLLEEREGIGAGMMVSLPVSAVWEAKKPLRESVELKLECLHG